jgi:PTH1 family peptidyl-tRNA hydrolase
MFVFAGLGNPGAGYAGHRHNVGFMAVDAIAQAHGFRSFASKFGGQLAEGQIAGVRVFAFKPMEFMNLSGLPLQQLVSFYKVPLLSVCVLHDELDLKLGKLRVKRGGGHGGHNGLKSIDAHLGAEYMRVRIGIDRPEHKNQVSDYVLSDFTAGEIKELAPTLEAIATNCPLLIAGNEAGFMNRVTLATTVLEKPASSTKQKTETKD